MSAAKAFHRERWNRKAPQCDGGRIRYWSLRLLAYQRDPGRASNVADAFNSVVELSRHRDVIGSQPTEPYMTDAADLIRLKRFLGVTLASAAMFGLVMGLTNPGPSVPHPTQASGVTAVEKTSKSGSIE